MKSGDASISSIHSIVSFTVESTSSSEYCTGNNLDVVASPSRESVRSTPGIVFDYARQRRRGVRAVCRVDAYNRGYSQSADMSRLAISPESFTMIF